MPNSGALAPGDAVAASLHDGKTHLLLAASGSVATIKIPLIISALRHHRNLAIRVVLTGPAADFLNGSSAEQPAVESLLALPGVEAVYRDEDERSDAWTRGLGILHINLRKWADLLVIAPLSANTLAKIANGLCDSLLTNLVRAWDTSGRVDAVDGGRRRRKRILVFPAMNAAMWLQPVTAKHIRVLEEEWGVRAQGSAEAGATGGDGDDDDDGWFEVFRPIEKTLACGDTGIGGMREWTEVVSVIQDRLNLTG